MLAWSSFLDLRRLVGAMCVPLPRARCRAWSGAGASKMTEVSAALRALGAKRQRMERMLAQRAQQLRAFRGALASDARRAAQLWEALPRDFQLCALAVDEERSWVAQLVAQDRAAELALLLELAQRSLGARYVALALNSPCARNGTTLLVLAAARSCAASCAVLERAGANAEAVNVFNVSYASLRAPLRATRAAPAAAALPAVSTAAA